jgi:hypothetical protein
MIERGPDLLLSSFTIAKSFGSTMTAGWTFSDGDFLLAKKEATTITGIFI